MAAQTLPIRIVIEAFNKSLPALRATASGLGAVAAAAVSMRTALVAAGGVAGFAYLTKQSLNATDSLAKTAQRIGTTTEALSKLQYAASISGVNTETLNMAMQRFIRRTAEAAQGTGEAVGALRELGIDARAIQQLPLDQRMLALADAFEQVTNSNDELRLGFKLFDSEGTAVLNMLRENRDGLKAMYDEAETLGLVMSGTAAAGVERANDAFTKLGGLFKGLTSQMVAAMAPAIEAMTDAFTESLLSISETKGGVEALGKFLAQEFLQMLSASVKGFEDFINFFIDGINDIIEAINIVRDASNEWLGTSFEQFKKLDHIKLGKIISEIDAFAEAIQESAAATNQAMEEMTVTAQMPWYAPLLRGLDAFADSIKTVIDGMNSVVDLQRFTQATMDSFTNGFADAIAGAKSFKDAFKDMARSIINDLIRMAVQYYITQQIFGALTGFIGGLGAGPAASGGGGASTGASGGMRAVGGPVSAGAPYLVGERGPELFVPSASGQVIPNGRMGGGATVNQTINISTGVAQTVRAEVLNLMPQIAESAKAAVADARMRGGGYSKALMGM
jgi:hypothetical protein